MPGGHLARTPHSPSATFGLWRAVQEWGTTLSATHVAPPHSSSLEIIPVLWQGQNLKSSRPKRHVELLPESQADFVPVFWAALEAPGPAALASGVMVFDHVHLARPIVSTARAGPVASLGFV